jgi:hypothetical protein
VGVDADEAPQVGPAKILGVSDPAQHATHSIISRLGSSSAPDDSGAGRNGATHSSETPFQHAVSGLSCYAVASLPLRLPGLLRSERSAPLFHPVAQGETPNDATM